MGMGRGGGGFFVGKVEISLCVAFPLFRPGLVHSGSSTETTVDEHQGILVL